METEENTNENRIPEEDEMNGEEEEGSIEEEIEEEEVVEEKPKKKGKKEKQEKGQKQKKKKIRIPTDSASFFNERNRHPSIFTFTSNGDLQIPEIEGQPERVIELPFYTKASKEKIEDYENERHSKLLENEREYDETIKLLNEAVANYKLTGAVSKVLEYQRKLQRLDAERTQLKSPERWVKEYKRLSIRELMPNKPHETKKLGYPVIRCVSRSIPSNVYLEVVSKQEYLDRLKKPEEILKEESEDEEEKENYTIFYDPADVEYGILSPETMLDIIYNNTKYSSALQAYEVERVTQLGRKDIRPLLLRQRNPKMIRQLGSRVVGKLENPLELWISILKTLINQHPEVKEILLNTGDDILVYADPKDTLLGVGLSEEDERIRDNKEWKGENLLGKAWKVVRSDLQELEEDKEEVMKGGDFEGYEEQSKTVEDEQKEKRKGFFIGLTHRRKMG